jgi:hypothetical protein
VAIIELKDRKWWRDTHYYGEPFKAPEWRAQWAESTYDNTQGLTYA